MNQLIKSIKILTDMTKHDMIRLKKNEDELYKIEQSVISAVDTTPWTLNSEGIVVKEEIDGVPMALTI